MDVHQVLRMNLQDFRRFRRAYRALWAINADGREIVNTLRKAYDNTLRERDTVQRERMLSVIPDLEVRDRVRQATRLAIGE